MARLRSKSARDEAAEKATENTTQEGAEEQAPQTEENPVTVTEPEVEQTVDADTENTDAAQPAESGESGDEQAQAPAQAQVEGEGGEAPAEKSKDDLEAEFRAKCEEAVENSDESTGSVPEIFVAKVLDAYRALPSTASKSLVKNWLGEEMRQALIDTKINRARALSDINAKVQDASTRRSAAAPAKPSKSPNDVYLESCLALDLAKQFVPRPKDEELDDNFGEQYSQRYADLTAEGGEVQKYLTWLNAAEAERGDEPEVDQVVKNAAKLASGRAVGGRKSSTKRTGGSTGGPRRNVGAHIEEFLAQADPNAEYTVADVANYSSTEYGEDHPSPGAVAARLFPSSGKASTIQGFEQVPGVEPKKIRKI